MIHEILLPGAENAQNSTDICKLLHIGRRELGFAVERERRAGHPICASTDVNRPGYFLAANKKEMERYCASLMHRAGELHKTRRACLGTLDKLPDVEREA